MAQIDDNWHGYGWFIAKEVGDRYKLYWLYSDTSNKAALVGIDAAHTYDKALFRKLATVTVESVDYVKLGCFYESGYWGGGLTFPDSFPRPLPFDPKYPSGGAVGFPYGTYACYHAALLSMQTAVPLRAAYTQVLQMVGPGQTNPLREAAALQALGDPYDVARQLAAKQIAQWVKANPDHALVSALESALHPELPGFGAVSPSDQQWWTATYSATLSREEGWIVKAIYGMIDAARSLGA